MYYLRARFYDPDIRRFISEDPAHDGRNWYAYCNGNPIKYWDPSGKSYGAVALLPLVPYIPKLLDAAKQLGLSLENYVLLYGPQIADAVATYGPIALDWILVSSSFSGITAPTVSKTNSIVEAGKNIFMSKKKDSDEVDWDKVDDNLKHHIAHGTQNQHEKGWKKMGFNPNDPHFFEKALPLIKQAIDLGQRQEPITGKKGVVYQYFYTIKELGVQLKVNIIHLFEGGIRLGDVKPYIELPKIIK